MVQSPAESFACDGHSESGYAAGLPPDSGGGMVYSEIYSFESGRKDRRLQAATPRLSFVNTQIGEKEERLYSDRFEIAVEPFGLTRRGPLADREQKRTGAPILRPWISRSVPRHVKRQQKRCRLKHEGYHSCYMRMWSLLHAALLLR